MNGKIFLNLQGNPTRPDSMCLSHSHGHYAYVSTDDTFIHNFFRDICIWGGSTNLYVTKKREFYRQYELDCRDKAFFKSNSFKKICEKHNIELVIFDDNDDRQIIIDFWEQMDRK